MEKKKRQSLNDVRDELIDTIRLKNNEAKGMHISSSEAQNALTAVATAYNRVAEIDERRKETKINLFKATAGAVGMLIETWMYERDVNTALGMEYKYHTGDGEVKYLRKNFKPRRLLEK